MKITSTSMIPDHETFNLDLFSGLFCENEFPDFIDEEFWGRGGLCSQKDDVVCSCQEVHEMATI